MFDRKGIDDIEKKMAHDFVWHISIGYHFSMFESGK